MEYSKLYKSSSQVLEHYKPMGSLICPLEAEPAAAGLPVSE